MENASQEGFCKEEADREVSEMEESLDVEQENENETSVEAPTGTITGPEKRYTTSRQRRICCIRANDHR